MNPGEDIEAVAEEEAETEEKEKTICARLVLSNEQVIITYALLILTRTMPETFGWSMDS